MASVNPSLRIDDRNAAVATSGQWVAPTDSNAYAGTLSIASQAGATATVTFTGTSIAAFGYIPPHVTELAPVSTYSIDGGPSFRFEATMGDVGQNQVLFWQSGSLSPGQHRLLITTLNSGTIFALDSFVINGAASSGPQNPLPSPTRTTPTPPLSPSPSSSPSSPSSPSPSSSISSPLSDSSTQSGLPNLSAHSNSVLGATPSTIVVSGSTIVIYPSPTTGVFHDGGSSLPAGSGPGSGPGNNSGGTGPSTPSKFPLGAVIGAIIGAILLIILLFLFYFLRRRRQRQNAGPQLAKPDIKHVNAPSPPRSSYSEPTITPFSISRLSSPSVPLTLPTSENAPHRALVPNRAALSIPLQNPSTDGIQEPDPGGSLCEKRDPYSTSTPNTPNSSTANLINLESTDNLHLHPDQKRHSPEPQPQRPQLSSQSSQLPPQPIEEEPPWLMPSSPTFSETNLDLSPLPNYDTLSRHSTVRTTNRMSRMTGRAYSYMTMDPYPEPPPAYQPARSSAAYPGSAFLALQFSRSRVEEGTMRQDPLPP